MKYEMAIEITYLYTVKLRSIGKLYKHTLIADAFCNRASDNDLQGSVG